MFQDRVDAGRQLAVQLKDRRASDVVVVGLPRGGVPVAAEVARALGAPLDIILVRKVGAPTQPELAMGAIGEGAVRVVNPEVVAALGVSDDEFARVERGERIELDRRAATYREAVEALPLAGRTVIVVDDGLATGSTARAACQVVRAQGAKAVILAVPVISRSGITRVDDVADHVVFVEAPPMFAAVGAHYRDFAPTTDYEVVTLLRAARATTPLPPLQPAAPEVDDDLALARDPDGTRSGPVEIPVGDACLHGILTVPAQANGLVVFVHGEGSDRLSPRNAHVADALHEASIATLRFDQLTDDEAERRQHTAGVDLDLFADRLTAVTAWARRQPALADLDIGYFGASTGAASALQAASAPDADIVAVVSRGGRPDLVGARLAGVRAPTLLIVGSEDHNAVERNRAASTHLRCEHRLTIVVGAGHLFEESDHLDAVARLATQWFAQWFAAARDRRWRQGHPDWRPGRSSDR